MGEWKRARLDEIGDQNEPGYWDKWARASDFGGKWRTIGAHLGISGFGVAANEADAGDELVVEHDEVGYGDQEELYYIVQGRARFVLDGTEVEIGKGELLLIPPEVVRQADALDAGTLVFMVGGTPGKPYVAWF